VADLPLKVSNTREGDPDAVRTDEKGDVDMKKGRVRRLCASQRDERSAGELASRRRAPDTNIASS
jgi:hypothetical protein